MMGQKYKTWWWCSGSGDNVVLLVMVMMMLVMAMLVVMVLMIIWCSGGAVEPKNAARQCAPTKPSECSKPNGGEYNGGRAFYIIHYRANLMSPIIYFYHLFLIPLTTMGRALYFGLEFGIFL